MPESLFEWNSFNYAILSMRKVKFKIIWDTGMYLFFEKGMRCGVFIFLWVIVFNNKYLKYYYPKQESSHITYLDANNLCPNFFQQVNSNG